MSKFKMLLVFTILAMTSRLVLAEGQLELQPVVKDVYAIVGEMGQRSKTNLGNNATFGLVVTRDGVVLIDSGGTYAGAKAIDAVVKTVTSKPVVKVINTGGQDHRWLGNDYFRQQGAEIIASKAAVKDQQARVEEQFFMLGNFVAEKDVKATNPVYADQTFDDKLDFELGGISFQLRHTGQAHTPGDSFVWLPQQGVMFAGDIVYTERLLGIMGHSNSKSWVEVFESMAAYKPAYVVPGHGHATTLAHAEKDTYNYLVDLRKNVATFMDDGRDISEIGKLDQSKYKYLGNFDTLSGRNAQKVFTELEWE